MVYLGDPGGGESAAYSVSGDGSVVVGTSSSGNAFRWTATGGMQDIGTLGGYGSAAYDVSANGSVVVGDATTGGGLRRAFRWTASTGMQNLSTTYSGSVGSGSYLVYANAVSADGLHVVGYGYNKKTNRWEAYYTN
jgi:probable HAF family extracellular repeat protein